LAYVFRDNIAAPPLPDPSSRYSSVEEEMIMRAPHTHPMYRIDNTTVWNSLSAICGGHSCNTYIQPAKKAKDGRTAMQLLHNHYLGPNNVQFMATKARTTLERTHYSGERAQRWNFEKFINVHYEQHAILTGLVTYGYSGIDEPTKVQYLLDGVKTDKLESVRTNILASAPLRSDLGRCVTLMQDYIRQDKTNQPRYQVAAVRAGRGGRAGRGSGRSGRAGRGSGNNKRKSNELEPVENRYYTSEEYNNLSLPQRNFLRQEREKQSAKDVKIASLASQVSELTMTSAKRKPLKKKKKVTL
jgi:hypothetical protein